VNAKGQTHFVKFHWTPAAGTHSLDWDESVKIAGADPDYTRRDLWESIEAGVFPEYELGFQIFTEAQADKFSFDVLDATKIVPEELVPVTPVGRMILNRNPDNFFAETEQVAFGVQNLVPGIDFSRPAAGGAYPLVLRHTAPAARRAELPRDPDQCADRTVAQQPAGRLSSPGHPSGPRRV
jgi:catalase